MIEFIDTSFTITFNHKQFTKTHNPSCKSAFTSRYLVTGLSNGDPSASVVTPFPAG
jgi:hypothetical protein